MNLRINPNLSTLFPLHQPNDEKVWISTSHLHFYYLVKNRWNIDSSPTEAGYKIELNKYSWSVNCLEAVSLSTISSVWIFILLWNPWIFLGMATKGQAESSHSAFFLDYGSRQQATSIYTLLQCIVKSPGYFWSVRCSPVLLHCHWIHANNNKPTIYS